tara:strand:- start:1001 stop:3580 length:2580 start_codon:yes stop_codon:yes gene_type:complete
MAGASENAWTKWWDTKFTSQETAKLAKEVNWINSLINKDSGAASSGPGNSTNNGSKKTGSGNNGKNGSSSTNNGNKKGTNNGKNGSTNNGKNGSGSTNNGKNGSSSTNNGNKKNGSSTNNGNKKKGSGSTNSGNKKKGSGNNLSWSPVNQPTTNLGDIGPTIVNGNPAEVKIRAKPNAVGNAQVVGQDGNEPFSKYNSARKLSELKDGITQFYKLYVQPDAIWNADYKFVKRRMDRDLQNLFSDYSKVKANLKQKQNVAVVTELMEQVISVLTKQQSDYELFLRNNVVIQLEAAFLMMVEILKKRYPQVTYQKSTSQLSDNTVSRQEIELDSTTIKKLEKELFELRLQNKHDKLITTHVAYGPKETQQNNQSNPNNTLVTASGANFSANVKWKVMKDFFKQFPKALPIYRRIFWESQHLAMLDDNMKNEERLDSGLKHLEFAGHRLAFMRRKPYSLHAAYHTGGTLEILKDSTLPRGLTLPEGKGDVEKNRLHIKYLWRLLKDMFEQNKTVNYTNWRWSNKEKLEVLKRINTYVQNLSSQTSVANLPARELTITYQEGRRKTEEIIHHGIANLPTDQKINLNTGEPAVLAEIITKIGAKSDANNGTKDFSMDHRAESVHGIHRIPRRKPIPPLYANIIRDNQRKLGGSLRVISLLHNLLSTGHNEIPRLSGLNKNGMLAIGLSQDQLGLHNSLGAANWVLSKEDAKANLLKLYTTPAIPSTIEMNARQYTTFAALVKKMTTQAMIVGAFLDSLYATTFLATLMKLGLAKRFANQVLQTLSRKPRKPKPMKLSKTLNSARGSGTRNRPVHYVAQGPAGVMSRMVASSKGIRNRMLGPSIFGSKGRTRRSSNELGPYAQLP